MSLAKKLARSALALSLSAVLPSCDASVTAPGAGGSAEPRRISVVLDRSDLDLFAGESARFAARIVDGAGAADTTHRISWSSSTPAVAGVGPDGTVSGVRSGTATITATVGRASATARVRVSTRAAALRVSPREDTLELRGAPVWLSAAALDADGAPIPDAVVSWRSLDPAVATVDAEGRVTPVAAGVAVIGASAGGQAGTVRIVVKGNQASLRLRPDSVTLDALGDTVRLAADARDARGIEVGASSLKWTSLRPAVATVSAAGVVTAAGAGTALVTAQHAGLVDTTVVQVRQVVASVVVTPAAPVVHPGQTQQMTALARDANAHEVPGLAFAWTSSNPAAATVSASGVATGVAAGTSYVTATAGGKSATATLTVAAPVKVPPQVASVSVSPATASIVVGGSVLPVATAWDAAGNALTGRAVEWSTSDASVAAVSASGVVTGVGVGSATITATVDGKRGSASVGVAADPATVPARLVVSPAADTLHALGASLLLEAAVYSQAGTRMSGAAVGWSSLDAEVAAVDGAGRVVAKAPGKARIVAASGRLADTATVVVRQVVAAVAVTPSSATLQPGRAQQLTASARDANGNPVPGVSFAWTSSNPAAATVGGAGLVAAVAQGVSYVTAAAGGKSAVATVTVTAAPVASVAVTPASASVAPGGTVSLAAVARDAAGQVLTGRPVAWASSNPAVATVSATGVVTGVAPGSATVTATTEGVSGTSAVTVTQPAAPDPGAGPFAAPDLASHDFEDGRLGAYSYPWAGTSSPENLRVVPDPTGAGKGRVVQVDFLNSAPARDVNRALFYSRNSSPYGLGSPSLFFRADLNLGTWAPGTAGPGDQRKLVYWKDENSGFLGYTLLVMWGNSLRVEQAYVLDGKHVYRQATVATLAQNRWYTLEVQVTPNSSAGASDGALRVWIDGALVHQWTDVRFFPTADYRYRGFGLGYQLQTATATGNETRYFDRVAFSTRRIGP